MYPTCAYRNRGWDCGGEKAHCTQGECAHQAPGCLSSSSQGRHKMQAQPSPHFCGITGTGTARNTGPAPYRAAGSMRSVDGESTHPWAGQTQCGQNTVSAPHTQRYLSAAPLPPHSTTEPANLNKRPPPPACVTAKIRHWRDWQTETK